MTPNLDFLNATRVTRGFFSSSHTDGAMGLFSWDKQTYRFTIISSGDAKNHDEHWDMLGGWEHVSVSKRRSRKSYMPTWEDMCCIKDLFWGKHETVLQFHPKQAEYVNCHPYVLHLWKKAGVEHELPPSILVGPR